MRADPNDGDKALALFRSNRLTGLLLALAFAVVGLSSAGFVLGGYLSVPKDDG